MKSISFLHFSDLHLGLNSQSTLISKFKDDLFQDIRKVHSYNGDWDIVFFTGDFVQSGRKEEYDQVTIFLKDLWNVFNELGCDPIFIGVPGNHDLEWTDNEFDSRLQYLLEWGKNTNFSNNFFWNKENEYRSFIEERFRNYVEWYDLLDLPKPSKSVKGYLPGDFACIMDINDIKIGCACLNSSYLQLNSDNFYGRLDIHSNQLTHLFQNKYIDWIKSVDIPLLVTHQPPSWLSPISKKNFDKEIYFPDSFINHLCGHMHDPQIYQSESIISTSRKTQIAPSLFGLEKTGDDWTRIQGYFSGKFEISDSFINEYIYPRIMVEAKDGNNIIAADNTFNLIDEKYIRFPVREIKNKEEKETKNETHFKDNNKNVFELSTSEIKEQLPRTYYTASISHYTIRNEERKNVIQELRSARLAWVITGWGLGENQFIGSVLAEAEINEMNCFSIDCSDVYDIERLKSNINNNFHVSFNNFISILAQLNQPLLVLDRVHPDFYQNKENLISLLSIIKSITDFASNLKIIILTERKPNHKNYIELLPLDKPAIKLYSSAFNINDLELNNYIAIDKLHKLTSGLPVYLDQHLEELKYCSLSDIIDRDFDEKATIDSKSSFLFEAINELKNSDNEDNKRSFALLSILSLLEYGETFERIKRFNPTAPLYINNVTILEKLSLLDVTTINSISFSNIEITTQKLLKIKRAVRDYMIQILNEEKKVEIYKNACELYFGPKWRTGGQFKIVKSSTIELNSMIFGNCFETIKFLLQNSIKTDSFDAERFAKIAILFCETLSGLGMYRDCVDYAENLYNTLKNSKLNKEKVYIAKIYGETLRMNDGIDTKSIDVFNSVLEEGDSILSKNDKASVNLELANQYSYQGKDYKNFAIKHAETVKKLSDKDSAKYIAAEALMASFDEKNRIQKLKKLSNLAKKHGYIHTQNNILLDLAHYNEDSSEKLKFIDNVITNNKEEGFYSYDKVRAIINKAELYERENKIRTINLVDLKLLNQAYSYLFYQSFLDLFDRCHNVIWIYLKQGKEYKGIFNLFRYSSFVWRIVDKGDHELFYLNDLMQDSNFLIDSIIPDNYLDNINKTYFIQRKEALLSDKEPQL